MPKKISSGAQRRSAARVKSQVSSKSTPALATRRTTARRTKVNKDPELSAQPVEFSPSDFKFVLTPPNRRAEVQEPPAYENLGELPDVYGTKKTFLVARDPHWLYVYWDLNDDQFMEATHASHDGKVFLEIFKEGSPDRVCQIQIPRGVRNWYVPSGQAGATFHARLGYYRADGGFGEISHSAPAQTPRDYLSPNTRARFATIPFHLSFRELFDIIRAQMQPGEELADALARLQEEGFEFPYSVMRAPKGDANTAQAVMDHLGEDYVRTIRMGSAEITEIIRRRLQQMVSSGQWTSSRAMSSPMGASFGAVKDRQFFMHVNAELIIYGGTDPKAAVTVNGQPIKLREDGTFSYHFTLPDGRYFIPIEATSPDKVETRSALLSFLRMTDTQGEVTATPQEPRPEPLGRAD